jgi:small-conductance mechanosensitive channel
MSWSNITDAVTQWWQGLDLTMFLIGIGATVAATILLWIALRVLRRIFSNISARFHSWEGTRIRPLQVQQQELLAADDIVRIIDGLLWLARLVLVVLLAFAYLSLVMSFFPRTRSVVGQAFDYLLTALGAAGTAVVGYLPNLLTIAFIALAARYLIKFAELIFNGIRSQRVRIKGFYPEWATPTFNIVKFLFIVFALVMIFPLLPGSASPAFRGVSIFFGVLVSLGSTAAVANVIAGVVITYTRAFQMGNRVRIAEAEGDVIERTMFVTRVRTPKNVEISIPNAMVLANHIINYSAQAKDAGLVLHTTITIGYDVPWRQVHELLVQAAKDTEFIEEEPEPFVLQTSLDDFYVSYELNATTQRPRRMPAIYSELHSHIQDRFFEAGIEIASPHYSAIRDGSHAAIPDEHLPTDYQPPPFRIHPLEMLTRRKPPGGEDGSH